MLKPIFLVTFTIIAVVSLGIALFVVQQRRREESIQTTEMSRRFESLIEKLEGGILTNRVMQDGKFQIKYMSEGWTKLTGYTKKDMEECFAGDPRLLILEEDRLRCLSDYEKQTYGGHGGGSYHLQYRLLHKDGSIRWIHERGLATGDHMGRAENQHIITDETEVKQQEEQLRISEERFRMSNIVSDTAIYEYSLREQRYTYFENTLKVLGIEEEQIIGLFNAVAVEKDEERAGALMSKLVHPDDITAIQTASRVLIETGQSGLEVRFVTKEGYRWCKLNKTLIRDEFGTPLRVIGAFTSIDENKRRAEALSIQIKKEPLTGLYNRMAAKEFIEAWLAENPESLCALFLIDIDDFKGINDTMGHTFGDMVLLDVATRLKGIFKHGEMVARFGGDEFMVFVPHLVAHSAAAVVAEEVCNAFRFTYSQGETGYKTSCSVGVVCGKQIEYATLIDQADLAMYDAKHRGKDRFAMYDSMKKYQYARTEEESKEEETAAEPEKRISQRVFDLLYSTTDFVGGINMVLSFLCNTYGFSHAYIFEYTTDKRLAMNTFEWTTNQSSATLPTLAPLEGAQMEKYDAHFKEHRYFYSADATNYNAYAQNALELRKINAILHLPLMQGKEMKGLAGFGKVSPYEKPTEDEIATLLQIMQVLSMFICKQRIESEIYHNSKFKAQVVDELPMYVYVTDNDHRILFMNRFLSELNGMAQIGEKCYNCFSDQGEVCFGCPKFQEEGNLIGTRIATSKGYEVFRIARKIVWEGKEAYVVACQVVEEVGKE